MREFYRRLALFSATMLVLGMFLAAFGFNSYLAAQQEVHRIATAAAATGQAAATIQAAATQAAAAEARALTSSIGAVADRSAVELARNEAIRQARLARADALALESASLLQEQPELARLLAVAAFRLADTYLARDNLVRAWQAIYSPSIRLTSDQAYTGFALSPNGSRLAAAREDGSVALLNPTSLESLGTPLEGRSAQAASLAFSPDGKLLATGYADSHLVIFDLGSGSATVDQSFAPVEGSFYELAFSKDGHWLASAAVTNTVSEQVWLWDATAWKPIFMLPGASGETRTLAFHPGGYSLATGSTDGGVLLWDLTPLASTIISPTVNLEENPVATHLSVAEGVRALAFTPDGNVLATGNASGEVILWNWITSQRIGDPLHGSDSPVTALAFSPDGRYLAIGQEDGSLVILEAVSGKPLGKPFAGQEVPVSYLAFGPDSKWLVSGGQGSRVLSWPLDPERWAADLCRRVHRNLTQAEWNDYLPGIEYNEVCKD